VNKFVRAMFFRFCSSAEYQQPALDDSFNAIQENQGFTKVLRIGMNRIRKNLIFENQGEP
jgi:hypothetical protein